MKKVSLRVGRVSLHPLHPFVSTSSTESGMWQIEIRHDGLHKYRVVKGATQQIAELRAEMQLRAWNEQWERVQGTRSRQVARLQSAYSKTAKKQLAADRTAEAESALGALRCLLTSILEEDHAIDWSKLKDSSSFPLKPPIAPPDKPTPREPDISDPAFRANLNFLTRLIPPIRDKESARVKNAFVEARRAWLSDKADVERCNREQANAVAEATTSWEAAKNQWTAERDQRNGAVDQEKEAYISGNPEAIVDYNKMVLSTSKYPESFPAEAIVDYIPETRMVVVEYSLPDISALPTVKEVKYVATRDDLQEVYVTEAWLNREYDSVLYQIALRSLYELFQADAGAAIDSIVFNGWVNSIDKATGKEVNACVLSIATSKTEFMGINLANVDAKACFKKLKGVSAAKLTALQPVRPILQINREDKRFIPAYDVAGALDSSSNLAAMDWEDFEHLIRQLFEEEFSADGGEVKITQASRDGGVDAIVFDPDPIRGGKIVIQAKRYTNTVSVSAVRDLFGTIHNEGANKGILVTTADYGPDAYEFAKGKPITLISGSELLYLLNKHGHKARIDLKEARLLAAEAETLSHRPIQ